MTDTPSPLKAAPDSGQKPLVSAPSSPPVSDGRTIIAAVGGRLECRVVLPPVSVLARHLAYLADEPLDDVSQRKYEGDAASILDFIMAGTTTKFGWTDERGDSQ